MARPCFVDVVHVGLTICAHHHSANHDLIVATLVLFSVPTCWLLPLWVIERIQSTPVPQSFVAILFNTSNTCIKLFIAQWSHERLTTSWTILSWARLAHANDDRVRCFSPCRPHCANAVNLQPGPHDHEPPPIQWHVALFALTAVSFTSISTTHAISLSAYIAFIYIIYRPFVREHHLLSFPAVTAAPTATAVIASVCRVTATCHTSAICSSFTPESQCSSHLWHPTIFFLRLPGDTHVLPTATPAPTHWPYTRAA